MTVTPVSSKQSSWNDLGTGAHAWHVSPDELVPRALRDRCLSWLSPSERAHYEQLRCERTRHEYLTTRFLCRATLSRYAGVHPSAWTFRRGTHGKPSIEAPRGFRSLHFNLTHTRGLAICLVSRAGEVGIDAEETSTGVDRGSIEPHFFSTAELARFEAFPKSRRAALFFAQWVLKEAYLKGIGRGLDAPERLTIEWSADDRPIGIGRWQLFLYRPTPHHVAAAAIERSGSATISTHWMTPEER